MDINVSNKEKRAKRAKVKAKNNRLDKTIKKKEAANERREFDTPQPSTYEMDSSDYVPSHIVPQLIKRTPVRFSSFNYQFNTLYGTVDEIQLDILGDDAEILTIDEEGVSEVFKRINELVCKEKVAKSEFQSVQNLYRDYLAVWCLSITAEKPKLTIPYCDWWLNNDEYMCMDEFGEELKINLKASIFDELKATFDIATHISESDKLLALIDEYMGYNLEPEYEKPWEVNSLKAIQYIDAYKNSTKPVSKSH
jgi:hypothetical protein